MTETETKAWCECGWSTENVREIDWEGAKPTCPTCGEWAEVGTGTGEEGE